MVGELLARRPAPVGGGSTIRDCEDVVSGVQRAAPLGVRRLPVAAVKGAVRPSLPLFTHRLRSSLVLDEGVEGLAGLDGGDVAVVEPDVFEDEVEEDRRGSFSVYE